MYADRLTLVAQDGTVLYDNRTNASEMENHAVRPEIAAAEKNGTDVYKRQALHCGARHLPVYRSRTDPVELGLSDRGQRAYARVLAHRQSEYHGQPAGAVCPDGGRTCILQQ